MGLGKITRTGGKVVAAIEVVRLVWLAGAGLVRAVRGRRSEHPAPDGPSGIEQPSTDRGDGQDGDQDHFEAR
jgi:hypothetical protein